MKQLFVIIDLLTQIEIPSEIKARFDIRYIRLTKNSVCTNTYTKLSLLLVSIGKQIITFENLLLSS